MSLYRAKTIREVTGHKALREALRDTQTLSSDLQGDADVRDYRQIPLEVDPPRHHLYRVALAPFFVKPSIEKHSAAFKLHSEKLLFDYFSNPPTEIVPNLSLPLVMQNLGAIYNRYQDVEEWISWGPDVWTAHSDMRSGKVLHNYLDRIYEEAITNSTQDIWRDIAHLEIENRQITNIEFRGIAGVLLAGGRDTVVKLISGILWHFAKYPQDLIDLRNDPERIPAAIQEFLRFLIPLPIMNRTTVPETGREELPPDRYVGMSFISANFDESVFTDPFSINLKRDRNPHLSFGFGPHTCLGNHVTEIEARVFLEVLVESNLQLKIHNECTQYHDIPYERVPYNFKSLQIVAIS